MNSKPALAMFITIACIAPSAVQIALAQNEFFVGVNLAGAEFQSGKIPGQYGKDYIYPVPEDVDYFLSKGMNTFRLPVRWERIQSKLEGPLSEAEVKRLDQFITLATEKGASVVIDIHNYGRYRNQVLQSRGVLLTGFADLWRRLAERYRDNPMVIFGLMNEPHGIDASEWRDIAQAAVTEIRQTSATNLILIPGTGWSGAHSWFVKFGDSSNADALKTITDPGSNMAFEAHQYMDREYSGTSNECRWETVGSEALTDFTDWLRDNDFKGFLGEFGASSNEICMAALNDMLGHVSVNHDVWIGWTYWAAGKWWKPDYGFSVQPLDGQDRPQMDVLTKYVPSPPN